MVSNLVVGFKITRFQIKIYAILIHIAMGKVGTMFVYPFFFTSECFTTCGYRCLVINAKEIIYEFKIQKSHIPYSSGQSGISHFLMEMLTIILTTVQAEKSNFLSVKIVNYHHLAAPDKYFYYFDFIYFMFL